MWYNNKHLKEIKMDNLEIIENLKKDLPATVAIIGYGSGIYKQTGYKIDEVPDKDVIIVVDNFKQFLIEDYKENPHHFSLDFSLKSLIKKSENTNFYNNIGCLKFNHNNIRFKAMVISKKALEQDLKTWKFFGMAGRLTKPIIFQNIPLELEEMIRKNRENILITALLFNSEDVLKPVDLYNTISKLTYMYDFRTILPGEKKTKATDIVSGAYDFFAKHYGHNRFIKTNTDYIINPHPIYSIGQLPDEISIYLINKLKNIDVEDMKKEELEQISKFIKMYFAKTNFINSLKLAISSSSTLGRKETVKHGLSKVKRHFLK